MGLPAHSVSKAKAPVRLLYLLGSLHVGGTEKLMVRLLEQLDRSRFHIVVGCFLREGELLADVEQLGVSVVALPLKPNHLSRIAWIYRTALWIRREEFDIVHCLQGTMIMYGGLAARLAGRPAVVSCERNMGYWLKSSMYSFAWRLACRRWVDLIVANAEVIKRRLMSVAGVPAENIRVVHDGVPVAPLSTGDHANAIRTKLGLRSTDFVVGIVANLRPVKTVDLLLDACGILGPSVHVVIVGDGPLREALERKAETLGVRPQIQFLGHQPDPLSIVPAFDVGVLCSRSEGFPRTVLEYMACGKAVVATSVGGLSECVEDGETGYLVEPGSATELAAAIELLQNDPRLRERMGKAGYLRVSTEFSLTREVGLYEDAYSSLSSVGVRIKTPEANLAP